MTATPDRTRDSHSDPTRRQFLTTSSAAVGGAITASAVQQAIGAEKAPAVHSGDDVLEVGLIGAGGRGSGAALNAMRAHPNNRLTAICEIFPDRLAAAKRRLETRLGKQMQVPDDHLFSNFDGYKRLLETDVDVVLLCTPPHFRPAQLKASIDAGKHVFCEKPVAVDAPGIRSVLATTEEAKKKGLSIVSGLCWRYDYGVRETMKRVQDGAIGDIAAIQCNYITGTLWHRGRQPDWSEMEFQIRNWLYFTWLSGDHNVEQHIHSLDKAVWLYGDQHPVACYGMGGRQVRTSEDYGNVYDHHAVCYEFPNNKRCFAFTRQMSGCWRETDDHVLGSKGMAHMLKFRIEGENAWKYKGPRPSMYDVEHKELFAGIRGGKPINNGVYMSYSTMMAIMGRMATYTGQRITWDMAINSKEDLSPEKYEWGPVKAKSVAMPGKTKFI